MNTSPVVQTSSIIDIFGSVHDIDELQQSSNTSDLIMKSEPVLIPSLSKANDENDSDSDDVKEHKSFKTIASQLKNPVGHHNNENNVDQCREDNCDDSGMKEEPKTGRFKAIALRLKKPTKHPNNEGNNTIEDHDDGHNDDAEVLKEFNSPGKFKSLAFQIRSGMPGPRRSSVERIQLERSKRLTAGNASGLNLEEDDEDKRLHADNKMRFGSLAALVRAGLQKNKVGASITESQLIQQRKEKLLGRSSQSLSGSQGFKPRKSGLNNVLDKFFRIMDGQNASSGTDATVVQQAQNVNTNSLFNAAYSGDFDAIRRMIEDDDVDVNAREAVGETIFHVCFLVNSDIHKKIAAYIASMRPQLINMCYEGNEYHGEHSLHIAIVNRDFEMVRWLVLLLVERGERSMLNEMRADGSFFHASRDLHFGETPISFAACTRQPEIVRFLFNEGADINQGDEDGNTPLHLLIYHRDIEMYNFIYNLRPDPNAKYHAVFSEEDLVNRQANTDQLNNDCLTPFMLAAKLGEVDMFLHLLDMRARIEWAYGPITCKSHPLDELDTAGRASRNGSRGVLDLITEYEQTQLISLPIISELLRKKWTGFARRRFFIMFFSFVVYFVIFSLAVYWRPSVVDYSYIYEFDKPEDYARAVAEIIVLVGAILQIANESLEVYYVGVWRYFFDVGRDHLLQWIFCTFIFIASILRILHSPSENIFVSLACVCAWLHLLYFARGFRLIGPFVVMIYKMLASDFLTFVGIYSLFLIGFSEAFYVLFKNTDVEAFNTLAKCFISLFRLMFMELEYSGLLNNGWETIAVILYILYGIIVAILMLNLLIAMMARTFSAVSKSADDQWRLQWAKIILLIEKKLSDRERQQHHSGVYQGGAWWFLVEERVEELELENDDDMESESEVISKVC